MHTSSYKPVQDGLQRGHISFHSYMHTCMQTSDIHRTITLTLSLLINQCVFHCLSRVQPGYMIHAGGGAYWPVACYVLTIFGADSASLKFQVWISCTSILIFVQIRTWRRNLCVLFFRWFLLVSLHSSTATPHCLHIIVVIFSGCPAEGKWGKSSFFFPVRQDSDFPQFLKYGILA